MMMSASRTKLHRAIVVAATVIAIGAVTGCHKKNSGINPNSLGPATAATGEAPTATITADPLAIDLGQSVVLNWRTQNATSVTIDGIGEVNANGTQTVSPSTSTNFHLTAKGDGGT
ncbi:MAG: flagellar motor protein MotB, partial [Edaphobacter sp.]